ncbi:MAG: ribonuclease III [Lachnospiraceae bacterium]|nr:ribonuclease III [Lachnospiraceae bacterium]
MTEKEALALLEERIFYTFRNKEHALEALRHSSYVFERKINKTACNERLEFLGDAVLELISSRHLFLRYPELPEGKLSYLRASLVCEGALAACAEAIGLGELIRLGKGEEACGGRKKASVVSDAYEALIGAIYLDGGLEEAQRFVERWVLADPDRHLEEKDAKTQLQEYLQKDGNVPIRYELVSESGPDHDKLYTVEVYVNDVPCGKGQGKNKKSAEKAAAAEALKYWKKEPKKTCI